MKKILYISLLLLGGIASAQIQVIYEGDSITAESISDDGQVVSLSSRYKNYKWTKETGVEIIAALTNQSLRSGRTSITGDGKKIAATATNPANNMGEMAIYDVPTGTWQYLGGIDNNITEDPKSSNFAISRDGKTLVGLGWKPNFLAHAIYWTQETGMVDMGSSFAGNSSRANDVSADGKIIVGWQDNQDWYRQGAFWENGNQTLLNDSQGIAVGEALAVSSDGKWIVGEYADYRPWIWSKTTGMQIIDHPDAGPLLRGYAADVSEDGKVVIGTYQSYHPDYMTQGFIWTPETGRVVLNDYLASLGVDITGYNLYYPIALSNDGKYVMGRGSKDGNRMSFVVRIPDHLSTNDINKTEVSIYPNPASNILNIKTKNIIKTVTIINTAGQNVITNAKVSNNQINISNLLPGNYLLTIKFKNKETKTFKFIKK